MTPRNVLLALIPILASIYWLPAVYLTLFTAIIFAYLLSPLVSLLDKLLRFFMRNETLSWNIACIGAILISSCIVLLLISIVLPILYAQTMQLYGMLVNERAYLDIIRKVSEFIQSQSLPIVDMSVMESIKSISTGKIESLISNLIMKIAKLLQDFTGSAWSLFISLMSSFQNILHSILCLVISFHVLREWRLWPKRVRMLKDNHLIAPYYNHIRIFTDMFHIGLQSWIKGQVMISLLLALYYIASFILISIPSPIVIGSIFGFVSFIPYIGDVIAFLALGIAASYAQISLLQIILSIVVVIFGHAVTAYLLVPLLIGKHVGIHPVQIILGFMINSKFFGFTGVLLNIPFCVIANALIATLISNKTIKKDIQE